MDLSEHFRVIWRRKWVVMVVSIAITALVYFASGTREDVYEAKARATVTSGRAATGEAVEKDDTVFLAATYAELGETRPVLDDAVRRSTLGISVSEADDRVRVSASSEVGFLTITAAGPTPDDARDLAQAVAESLVVAVRIQQSSAVNDALAPVRQEIADLEARLAELAEDNPSRAALETRYDALLRSATETQLRPLDRVTLVSPARASQDPVSPKPIRDAALAFLAAFIINAELMVLLEALSDRFSSENLAEDVLRVTGLPVLARVPRGSDEAVAEAFHALRTNLLFMNSVEGLQTMAVVSVESGAGKSFVCVNLARSVASLGIPSLLVDADLRRPVAHDWLSVSRVPGLTDALNGHPTSETLHQVPGQPNLRVLPAGSRVPDPAEFISGRPLRSVLSGIHAELIVVDTPAESIFADAIAVASQCNVTVIVIDLRSSRRRAVRNLVQRLRQVNSQPIGVVVNRAGLRTRASAYARYKDTAAATS